MAPAAIARRPAPAVARLLRARPARGLEFWLTLAACIAAALPVIVSTVRGMADGFVPNGDRGVIAIRAYDVFTANTPLVGQFSASSLVTGKTTHSPGPLLYWLLAPAAHLGGPSTLALTMGILDCAALVGAVLLARRRGGIALMLVVAGALALMCRSLPPEIYHDIWNPSVGVIPLTLLFFIGWSLACGEYRLLPLAALTASFTAQAELTFLLPTLAALAVGVAGLLGYRLRRARRERTHPPQQARGERTWPWWLAAALVAIACWTPPLVDELTGHPGNLSLIADVATAKRHTVGGGLAWHAVVRAVGIPPWWLRIPSDPFYMLGDVRNSPGALSAVSAVVVLIGLVAVGGLGLLRRRRDVASAAVLSLALCASLAAVAAATPTRPILMSSLGYTMWWGAPAGMWAWLSLGWGAAALAPVRRRDRATKRRAPARHAAVAGAAVALALGGAVAAAERPDQDKVEYRPARAAIARVSAVLPRSVHVVRVGGASSWTSFDLQAAIAYALRQRGLRPLATWAPKRIGKRYSIDHRYNAGVYVWDGPAPHPTDRVIARVPFATARTGVITITAAGAGGG